MTLRGVLALGKEKANVNAHIAHHRLKSKNNDILNKIKGEGKLRLMSILLLPFLLKLAEFEIYLSFDKNQAQQPPLNRVKDNTNQFNYYAQLILIKDLREFSKRSLQAQVL